MEELEKQRSLFQTLIQLMQTFFHLPASEQPAAEAVAEDEQVLLDQMITAFTQEKHRLAHAISVRYQLLGTPALQRWIKQEVCAQLAACGYLVYEADAVVNPPVRSRVQVTNRLEGRRVEIQLSPIPDQAEIANQVQQYAQRKAQGL